MRNVTPDLDHIMKRLDGQAGIDGLAVFVKRDGTVKMTAITTALYRDMLTGFGERLLGIYNDLAERRHIREDLEWAAEHMVEVPA